MAVAFGWNTHGQCNIPALDEGRTYTQVAAGWYHTVLLRSDGTAIACGQKVGGLCNIPSPADGVTYTQVAAGANYSILLKSDGTALACGWNTHGQCNIPALDVDVTYVQVAAGWYHTVLVKSDGSAVGFGRNTHGQCNIPALSEGMVYTQAVAGAEYTLLLRSDGTAVSCGGICEDIPPLDEGVTYTQAAAGDNHFVLLRSDGTAVACGLNDEGQCRIPSLKSWSEFFVLAPAQRHYVPCSTAARPSPPCQQVIQAFVHEEADSIVLRFLTLSGEERCSLNVSVMDKLLDLETRILSELRGSPSNFAVVLPGGQILSHIISEHPSATLGNFI